WELSCLFQGPTGGGIGLRVDRPRPLRKDAREVAIAHNDLLVLAPPGHSPFSTPTSSFLKRLLLLVVPLIPLPDSCLGACSDDDNGDDNDTGNGGGTRNTPFAFCGPATTCPPNTSGADLTTPVSFRTDIFEPIFQVGCNDATCHGHQTAARGKLWLGPPNGEVADEMLQTIVDNMLTPSATAPE